MGVTRGKRLKYSTRDGVEILTSKRREDNKVGRGESEHVHKKPATIWAKKSKNEVGRAGIRVI